MLYFHHISFQLFHACTFNMTRLNFTVPKSWSYIKMVDNDYPWPVFSNSLSHQTAYSKFANLYFLAIQMRHVDSIHLWDKLIILVSGVVSIHYVSNKAPYWYGYYTRWSRHTSWDIRQVFTINLPAGVSMFIVQWLLVQSITRKQMSHLAHK